MGLLSLFHREADASAGRRAEAGDVEAGSVEQLRTRARRRLIGSAILLGVAITAFSLLFETHPRPDGRPITVEVQRRDGTVDRANGVSGTLPAARSTQEASASGKAASAPPRAQADAATASVGDSAAAVVKDKPAAAPTEVPAAQSVPEERQATAKADTKTDEKSDPKPAAKPASEAERARALLEDRPGAVPAKDDKVAKAAESKPVVADKPAVAAEVSPGEAPGRFVVQVGAFADVEAARAVRQRVERLGMKTYTQVVQTAEGRRIRVRVGPYTSRSEADKALSRLTADGLKPAVLTL